MNGKRVSPRYSPLPPSFRRLADGAGRGVEEKSPVVRLSIVVAGRAKPERTSQNQKRGGKSPPVVVRVDQRRIERREVRTPRIELAFEGTKRGIDSKQAEKEDNG